MADGSEDVNDFLQRIKELGDRRDQEDEERNRKLEEEILQSRKERQARRAGTDSLSFVASCMGQWILADFTDQLQNAHDRYRPRKARPPQHLPPLAS